VSVRLGDRVTRGQRLAKIEDSELLEQIKQAEASFAVAAATIRQREADLGAARRTSIGPAICTNASCSRGRPSTTPRRAIRRRRHSSISRRRSTSSPRPVSTS
jgi:multidrug efflux pump subunit AcrA (membrane-fusion protein)